MYNINSGYGQTQMSGLSSLQPNAGKVFAVGIMADEGSNTRIANLFRPDPEGQPRRFESLKALLDAKVLKAGRGDIVFLLPNHVEEIKVAGGITLDVDGVTIYGLGNGTNRAKFTFTTATTSTMLVTGDGVTIQNVQIAASLMNNHNITIEVTGSGFSFLDNEVLMATGAGNYSKGILDFNASSNSRVKNNNFYGETGTVNEGAIRVRGGKNVFIEDNTIVGAYTAGVGGVNNTNTATYNLIIKNNVIINSSASSTKAITCLAATTAVIVNNRLGILSGTAPITANAAIVGGNYYAAAKGVSAATLI